MASVYLTEQEIAKTRIEVRQEQLKHQSNLISLEEELKIEKKLLNSRYSQLMRELTRLINILKGENVRMRESEKHGYRAMVSELREIEENLLPTVVGKIKDTRKELQGLPIAEPKLLREKQEQLKRKKEAALATAELIEARSDNVSKTDKILIFVTDNSSSDLDSGSNLTEILDGITPQFISEMQSDHQDIKVALLINRPIYDVMSSYRAYFRGININWVALRTVEKIDSDGLLDILSSIEEEFLIPKANLRIISNSSDVSNSIQRHGMSAIKWTSIDSKLYVEVINDPNDIVPWINEPTSHKLYLEQAVRSDFRRKINGGFRQVDAIDIQYFGRYFKKDDTRSFGADGILTQAILRAKHNHYSENIIEGLAEIIKTYPKNIWVTCIPDKEGKSHRMRTLLASLSKRQDLSDYKFADNFFLYFNDSSFSTKGLNAQQRKEKLGEVLQRKQEITLAGCDVLLLDDVVTSGATLKRGYECLLGMEADNVYCIAIASTVNN